MVGIGKWALAFAWLAASASVAAAPRVLSGTSAAGAAWRIAVPDNWKAGDGLVLVQHGFAFKPVTDPSLGPLAESMLADGYAVAASGYRQRGWALFTARDDNADLLDTFRAQVGEPGDLVMAGGSMGGLVSLMLAEDPRFRDATAGVLAFCPAADGVAAWDTAFDLRLAYDAICQPADGGDLPRGAEPTPWALDLDQLPDDIDDPTDSTDLLRSSAGIALCTGLGLPSALRTSGMRERLGKLMTVADTDDEDALLQQLAYAVVGLSDLVRAPDKLAGRVPFFNAARVSPGSDRRIEYGVGIDDTVRRVARDDFARLDFHRSSSLDGSADTRVVSLHTRGDAVVPLWHQLTVRQRYPDALIGVVRNDSVAHCGFSEAEVRSGWRTLRDWIAGGAAPTVATLDANCRASAGGECRFDAQTPDPVGAVPLRLRTTLTDVLGGDVGTVSGLWSSASQPSQGLMLEELDEPLGSAPIGEQRMAVYWYTWAPVGDGEPGPRWIVGTGRIHEAAFFADDLVEVRRTAGGVSTRPWGRIEFALDDRPGVLRYDGVWGRGERFLGQTTTSQLNVQPSLALDPPPQVDFHRIGTYYDPTAPGQGWVLNQYLPANGGVQSLLVWYTQDPDGRPAWRFGIDANADDGLQFAMTRAVQGGTFENGTPPTPPALQPWGTVTLESDACNITAVNWQSATPGHASGRASVQRLTAPRIIHPVRTCR